jgi:hypothetical protein
MTSLEQALMKALEGNPAFQKKLASSASPRKSKSRGRAKKSRQPQSDEQRTVNAAKNAVDAVSTFEALGYTNCVANETILTYGKWEGKGRRVKKGEKSTRINGGKGYPLFHIDQTEVIPSDGPAQ